MICCLQVLADSEGPTIRGSDVQGRENMVIQIKQTEETHPPCTFLPYSGLQGTG